MNFTKWIKTPQSGNNNYFVLKDDSIDWWPFGYMISCKFTLECIRKMPGQNQDYKPWFGTDSELLYSTEKYYILNLLTIRYSDIFLKKHLNFDVILLF